MLSLLAAKLCCFPLSLPKVGREVADPAYVHGKVARPLSVRRYDNLLGALRADDFALAGLWKKRCLLYTSRRPQPGAGGRRGGVREAGDGRGGRGLLYTSRCV